MYTYEYIIYIFIFNINSVENVQQKNVEHWLSLFFLMKLLLLMFENWNVTIVFGYLDKLRSVMILYIWDLYVWYFQDDLHLSKVSHIANSYQVYHNLFPSYFFLENQNSSGLASEYIYGASEQ